MRGRREARRAARPEGVEGEPRPMPAASGAAGLQPQWRRAILTMATVPTKGKAMM